MNAQKFTQKTMEAVQNALRLARDNKNAATSYYLRRRGVD